MTDDPLIASLRSAVAAAPDDAPLRLHLAELLLAAGERDEAVQQAATVLQHEPTSAAALGLLARSSGTSPADPPAPPSTDAMSDGEAQARAQHPSSGGGFDWEAAEGELEGIEPPRYVQPERVEPDAVGAAGDVEPAGITLADVAGMEQVKQRLTISFLMPMRNPELRRLYGKSLRGGLLLYGPPGCGKTYIARAVAGELGARFYPVALTDVLDPYFGVSERKLRAVFDVARANTPCVLFLDEIDALGYKRSGTPSSNLRTTVQSLLAEMDGVSSDNEGMYVLAATNAPWDVDAALKRPGRFDRLLLVLPPDSDAREAVLRLHLRDRPVENIDVARLAKRSDGLSGADLAHVCETAAEHAMADSVRTGEVRRIQQRDLERALDEVRPSTGEWLELARNVVLFANQDGGYDDLLAYLKKRKLV